MASKGSMFTGFNRFHGPEGARPPRVDIAASSATGIAIEEKFFKMSRSFSVTKIKAQIQLRSRSRLEPRWQEQGSTVPTFSHYFLRIMSLSLSYFCALCCMFSLKV